MDYEDFANENEFIEENSQVNNSVNRNKNISININNEENDVNNNINEINKTNNKNLSSDKELDKEKEEKELLLEINNLENEKEQFFKRRKEQNDILNKYMELLKSLQIKNEIELKDISIEDTNFELGELIKYNSMINKIESEERILEEEKIYYEKYKNNFNRSYEERQKEIEDLKLNYEKDKEEYDKKIELLEMEEKMVNDKYNNFEFEKKIITERYNNTINKEAELLKAKKRIENSLNELDRRNLIIEKNSQFINETKQELEYQIQKNFNEEKRILDEKNNLKIRQDMVDSLRIKYVGDITNSPFELMPKTFNQTLPNKNRICLYDNMNEYKNTFLALNQKDIINNNLKEKNEYSNYYDVNNQKFKDPMNSQISNENNQKKLFIIEEDKNIHENSESQNI